MKITTKYLHIAKPLDYSKGMRTQTALCGVKLSVDCTALEPSDATCPRCLRIRGAA